MARPQEQDYQLDYESHPDFPHNDPAYDAHCRAQKAICDAEGHEYPSNFYSEIPYDQPTCQRCGHNDNDAEDSNEGNGEGPNRYPRFGGY
jgi:hypothetical protein